MEFLLTISNVAFYMYVCGTSVLSGCSAQFVESDAVQLRDNGT